jgi:1,4-dihydroxy-2-naphthoate octaprenyltransferase
LAATLSLIAAGLIGLYFAVQRGIVILVLMVVGALSIRFYTRTLARWYLGECIAGLTLGTFVVLGSYYVLTGTWTLPVVILSVPPGLLTGLLLFLNEFPDLEADRRGGRRHLVILLGRRMSGIVYAMVLLAVYLIILSAVVWASAPPSVLVALLTVPLAIGSIRIVFREAENPGRLIPALAMNVGVVLLTDLLLAVGFWMA